jgi:chromosome segregation ATPase
MTKQRNDLDQQLASVTLQKDALFDEADNLRAEAAEARTQVDRVCSEAAAVNKARAELEIRLNQAERAMVSADERLKALRTEKKEQMEIIEELQTQLGSFAKSTQF